MVRHIRTQDAKTYGPMRDTEGMGPGGVSFLVSCVQA